MPFPVQVQGYPIPGSGGRVPYPTDRGVPHPGSRWGVLPCSGLDGVPPIQDFIGYPPNPGLDVVPPPSQETETA